MTKKIVQFIKENKEGAIFFLFIVCYVIVASALGIACPFRTLFGIPCAGCGMTRAWISVLHLDLASAFHYHPAFFVVPMVMIFWLFKGKRKKLYDTVLYIGIIYMLLVYVVRLIIPNDGVIDFELKKGIVYKAVNYFFESIKG